MRTSRRAGENALVNDMVTGWRSGGGVNDVFGLGVATAGCRIHHVHIFDRNFRAIDTILLI